MREIQMGSFQISHLFQGKKRQPEEPDDDKDDNPGKKKRMRNKHNKGETVRNRNLIPNCALKPNKKFGDIFHSEVKRAYKGKIPKLGSEEICQKFHSLGICHDECSVKSSHKTLVGETAEDWRKFCLFCKDERKRKQNNGK